MVLGLGAAAYAGAGAGVVQSAMHCYVICLEN